MSTNAALLVTAVAVKAERHGGTWFTYDAEGFVVDAGLSVDEAQDAVHAGRQGLTLAEYWHQGELEREEEYLRLARIAWT